MTIYIIERIDHYRDMDNRDAASCHLLDHHGYFTSYETAERFRANLEAESRRAWAEEVANEHKQYQRRLAEYEQRKAEIATLKAAGMTPSIKLMPKPAKPRLTEADWSNQEEYTSYSLFDIEPAGKETA